MGAATDGSGADSMLLSYVCRNGAGGTRLKARLQGTGRCQRQQTIYLPAYEILLLRLTHVRMCTKAGIGGILNPNCCKNPPCQQQGACRR